MNNKLSVCIPVYNAEKYIGDSIKSVLSQDYRDYEIIVIDDASTDQTVNVVSQFDDERIKLYHNDHNVGLLENFTNAIRYAKGDYIQILCADDILFPGALSKKIEILEKYPEVGCVFSASCVINENGKVLMHRRPFKKSQVFKGRELAKKLFCSYNFMAEPSNNMLRKSAVLKNGFFDPKLRYVLDWDYWLRLLQLCDAYYIDECMEGFRILTTSCTGQTIMSGNEFWKDELLFREKYSKNEIMDISWDMMLKRKINIPIRYYKKIIGTKIFSLFS